MPYKGFARFFMLGCIARFGGFFNTWKSQNDFDLQQSPSTPIERHLLFLSLIKKNKLIAVGVRDAPNGGLASGAVLTLKAEKPEGFASSVTSVTLDMQPET